MENTNNLELLENAFERTSILKTLAAGAIDKLADLETVLPPADLDRVNETTDFITALQHEIEAVKDDLSEAVRIECRRRINADTGSNAGRLTAEEFTALYTRQSEKNKRVIAELLEAFEVAPAQQGSGGTLTA